MRPCTRLLASDSLLTSSKSLRSQPTALLPPIPLYRRLLRAHRHKLNPEQRALGDEYVRTEFRAHRDVENPVHIIGFLTEWQMYAQAVEGDAWQGEKLDKAKMDKMSDQQLAQLYELMQAIKNREAASEEDVAAHRANGEQTRK